MVMEASRVIHLVAIQVVEIISKAMDRHKVIVVDRATGVGRAIGVGRVTILGDRATILADRATSLVGRANTLDPSRLIHLIKAPAVVATSHLTPVTAPVEDINLQVTSLLTKEGISPQIGVVISHLTEVGTSHQIQQDIHLLKEEGEVEVVTGAAAKTTTSSWHPN